MWLHYKTREDLNAREILQQEVLANGIYKYIVLHERDFEFFLLLIPIHFRYTPHL